MYSIIYIYITYLYQKYVADVGKGKYIADVSIYIYHAYILYNKWKKIEISTSHIDAYTISYHFISEHYTHE